MTRARAGGPGVIALAVAVALVAALHAQQAPPRDRALAPLVGSAAIGGTVSGAADGKPLSRAQLMIMGADNGYMKVVETDAQGHFAFPQLPAGRYLIGASKPPYLDMAYGAKRPGHPGTAVSVADGQHITNLAIKMMHGGAVTGFVTDDSGQPMPGATVRAYPIETKAGERVIGASVTSMAFVSSGSFGRTDERGIYRLYGLAPGEYSVVVTATGQNANGDVHVLTAQEIQAGLQAVRDPSRPGVERPSLGPPAPMVPSVGVGMAAPTGSQPLPLPPATGPAMGFVPIFYPGSTDAVDAASVIVAAGEERGGVDIRTRLVPMARVEGLVVVPFGETASNVRVTLQPAGSVTAVGIESPTQTSTRVAPDGRFVLASVPPGQYTLNARTEPSGSGGGGGRSGGSSLDPSASPPAAPPQQMWATTDIVVSGQPVSGIVLTMQPGMTVSGKIVFKPTSLPVPQDMYVSVSARPPQVESLLFGGGLGDGHRTTMKADGTFAIEGLMPDRFIITANVGPGGLSNINNVFAWTVESVMVGGRDITDLAIDLKPNENVSDVVITLTDRRQEVVGTLKESTGHPAPDYTVVLFSTDKQYWLPGSRRVVTARPSTDGRFEISGVLGLPPGSYFLAALTDLGTDEQYDPKLLEELSKAAVKLTLAPGERKQQALRIR